jgi:hypothetical protein
LKFNRSKWSGRRRLNFQGIYELGYLVRECVKGKPFHKQAIHEFDWLEAGVSFLRHVLEERHHLSKLPSNEAVLRHKLCAEEYARIEENARRAGFPAHGIHHPELRVTLNVVLKVFQELHQSELEIDKELLQSLLPNTFENGETFTATFLRGKRPTKILRYHQMYEIPRFHQGPYNDYERRLTRDAIHLMLTELNKLVKDGAKTLTLDTEVDLRLFAKKIGSLLFFV